MEDKYPLRKKIKSSFDISSLFDYNDYLSFKLKEDHLDKPL